MLTDEQRVRLLFAIDKAEGHGSLQYCSQIDGSPSCVTAQLAVMEKVPLKTVQRWAESIFVIAPKVKELQSYPPDLLQYLQFVWDNRDIGADTARARMRELVYAAFDSGPDGLRLKARELRLSIIG